MESLLLKNLYKTEKSIAFDVLTKHKYAHEAVLNIDKIIKEVISKLNEDFIEIKEGVFVHKGAKVSKSAELNAPCIIDEGAEIRHGAYIRGNVIVGKGCVVGNSCELKSAILYDGACVPHFNYVGNSILGHKAHMGAGAIISNLKSDGTNVKIDTGSSIFSGTNTKADTGCEKTSSSLFRIDTHSRKFGALVGDYAEIGCGSVLNPGTVIMPNASVYPLSSVRGLVPENSIYKGKGEIVKRKKHLS